MIVKCDNCGKSFKPHRRTKKRAAIQKHFFCSVDCFFEFKKPKTANSETKVCPNCSKDKSLISFCKQKRKDGTYSYSKNCNTCRAKTAKFRKYGKENLKSSIYFFCEETLREIKLCSRCKIAKPMSEYTLSSGRIVFDCLFCRRIKNKERFGNMSEKEKTEYRKKCNEARRNNPNTSIRAKNNRARITPEQKKKWQETRNEKLRKNLELRKQRYERKKVIRQQKLTSMSETERELFVEKERKGRRMRRQIRQARERGAYFCINFTKEDIIKRDGLNCYLCGKLLKLTKATLDHVLPLARGGQHKPENIKIACMFCNFSKNKKTLTEFKKYRGDYDYLK